MKNTFRTALARYSFTVSVAVVFLLLSYSRVLDEFEYSTLDLRYRIRPPQPVDPDIVIIEVGDDTIAGIGQWPLPRNYHALLIRALESAGVSTITFDIFFSEKREGDEGFSDTIRDAGNVYIPYILEFDRYHPDRSMPHAVGYAAGIMDEFRSAVKGAGFANVIPDPDGKIRRVPLFASYKGGYRPQITFLVALEHLGYSFDEAEITPGRKITVGDDVVIPLGEDSSMLVNYPARWGRAFRHYSYIDILQSYLADVTGQEATVDLGELKGSMCFIGVTAAASPDAHPSPMEPMHPGVGVHASVYNGIVNNLYLRRLGRWPNLLILLLLWLLTAYSVSKSGKFFSMLSILVFIAVYSAAAIALFWPGGIWIDLFYPLVSMTAIYVIFTLKKYIMEIRRRELIEKELDIAREIQRSFLPGEIPGIGPSGLAVRMLTARQVGGDLYDIVDLGGGNLGIMLGDVSGKGVPAALYMAKAVSVFRTYMREGPPAEVMKKMNERLVSESSNNLFVTLTYMVLDTNAGKAAFAIGGHLPTILIEPDGNVELLDVSEGMPLGLIDGDFEEGTREFRPGSILVLYSDGVTEAMNSKGEMYLQERLVELCRTLKGRPPGEVVEAIHGAVAAFAGKAPQHDDITVMAVKV